jgi:hypothetical protein
VLRKKKYAERQRKQNVPPQRKLNAVPKKQDV